MNSARIKPARPTRRTIVAMNGKFILIQSRSLTYFQRRFDVAEFHPVAVADDASAADFERHAVDIGPVAAGAVRQNQIAVRRERQRRMEIRNRGIVYDQSVRAVASYSAWFGVAHDARSQIARTAFDAQDDIATYAFRRGGRLIGRYFAFRRVLRDDGGFGFAEPDFDLTAARKGVVCDPDLNLAQCRVAAVVDVFVDARVQLALQEFATLRAHSGVGLVIVANFDQVRRDQARVLTLQVFFDRLLDQVRECRQIGSGPALEPAASAQREINRAADPLE